MQAVIDLNEGTQSQPSLADVSRTLEIQSHFHFIWFGSTLPEFAIIAVRSALRKNPGATATLWHSDDFRPSHDLSRLALEGLRLQPIDIDSLLSELAAFDTTLNTTLLRSIYAKLTQPAARANVIRMLVLYLKGGIYLDTDTLTVKDMSPLRTHGAFCGKERILWPSGRSKLDPRALSLAEMRRVLSAIPGGFRIQKSLDKYYSLAENNAVLGARAGHPLLREMLLGMLRVPRNEWTKRFRLGTHLLQETLHKLEDAERIEAFGIKVFAPTHFYPVGPKMSLHYFRNYRNAKKVAEELVAPETFVIHWYASVANLVGLDYSHIRKHEKRNVYSHLCNEHVPNKGASTQRLSSAATYARPLFI